MMKIIQVIVSIVIAQAAGLLGSFFTASSVRTWYVTLAKPVWNPPGWVFGPVWTLLYTLMGIAAYLVWSFDAAQDKQVLKTVALSLYGGQLVLNALWSILFFGLKNPGFAFAEILILLALIIVTTVLFWRINTWAGVLLLPYIAWVAFATALNYTIWQLN